MNPLYRRRALLALVPIACVSIGACAGAAPEESHDDEPIATSSDALVANDPVSSAVTASCTTGSVKGLSTQLVEEIQCLRPKTLTRIDKTAGLALGSTVFPYLQTPAASAVIAAQKARGVTMRINSALRTLPAQYLLYRWYQTGRCGIALAARPGTSNHESAVALDIEDNAGWRSAMTAKNFRWLGPSDPVHYDFVGGGTVSFNGLSVRAFQRLWNRNHPEDQIEVDGAYGPATETRLAKSPIGGFAKGAECDPDGGVDGSTPEGGTEDESGPAAIVPDAPEPDTDDGRDPTGDPSADRTRPEATTGGCSVGAPGTASGGPVVLALGLVTTLVRRRRPRKR